MKRFITALTLTAAAATAPAFADTALNGTVISTMGDASVVSLHPRERGIGDNGVVTANHGITVDVPASRIFDPRDTGKTSGNSTSVSLFTGNADVTNYGAR
ncbi:hypothetical protein [Lacimonas salitolerans]|uniref:Uncharacterized protein n=1 Tax=Lacimonas salitolerans TaxID=1323750 RepID=A0ABW4EB22_9RHOB